MSAGYRLTEPADADLQNIYEYTAKNWGFDQADRYYASLAGHFTDIVRNPVLGRDRSDLQPGTRSRRAEQHVVYYRIQGANVEILRVLHTRQRVDSAKLAGKHE